MGNERQFQASFFDGKKANAHDVIVVIDHDGISITPTDENNSNQWLWTFDDLILLEKRDGQLRFSHKTDSEAILVLDIRAADTITNFAPDLISERKERRKLTQVIVGMVAACLALTGGIFIGVPMLSGPLTNVTPKPQEIKMGENLATQINFLIKPCKDADAAIKLITPTIDKMATTGEVGFPIRFQFVDLSIPNAFALPGGQVMATKGLLTAVGDDQEAFLAVIAHELGHVKSRDGMRAFYRNAGLGILLEVITGGSGLAQQGLQLAGQINQLNHTRTQEALADDIAIDLMKRSSYNPEALARAFESISASPKADKDDIEVDDGEEKASSKKGFSIPGWLSSHPDTTERIKKARSNAGPSKAKSFTYEEWGIIQDVCSTSDD